MARSTFIQFSVLLVLAVSREAFADDPEKIVGGNRARPGEFPYQVSVRVYNQHTCGGTLISNEHVLTAAHCVYEHNPTYLSIVTGTTNLYGGGQTHRVKKVFYHSGYVDGQNYPNDIALIAGDSGGPLVANGELVGVVSWVIRCGGGYPDTYSRVYEHRDFINEAMRLSSQ